MDSLQSFKDSAQEYASKNPKTMKYLMYGGGAIVVLVIVYFIYKRMKAEGYDTTTPLYNEASGNQNYNDFGVMAGGQNGGTYATLSGNNTAADLYQSGYVAPK